TAMAKATVQDAPLLAQGLALSATERTATGTVNVATFSDANLSSPLSDYSATIAWGDGSTSSGTIVANPSGGFFVTGSHTYAEDGSAQITVVITDAGGASATANGTVTVADAALSATGQNIAARTGVATGSVLVATFFDVGGAEPLADYSATISWGDGTSSPATIVANANGSFSVFGNHTYAGSGNFGISVAITHEQGVTAQVTGTATVGANMTAKVTVLDPVAGAPFQGIVAMFTGSNPLAKPSDFTVTITWGDGSTSAGTVASDGKGGFTV